jgi:hypothetical protein
MKITKIDGKLFINDEPAGDEWIFYSDLDTFKVDDSTDQNKQFMFEEKRWLYAYVDHDGNLHREDGPALESVANVKYYYICGMKHRIDGPAIEYSNKAGSYYYKGNYIPASSQEEFERILLLKSFL